MQNVSINNDEEPVVVAPPPPPPVQALQQHQQQQQVEVPNQRDYTYNDLHSDTALHGYPAQPTGSTLHSSESTMNQQQPAPPPPANQPAVSLPPPANHQPPLQMAPPPIVAPPVDETPPANQQLPSMAYAEAGVGQQQYFQPNFNQQQQAPHMAELKSAPRNNDDDNEDNNQQYSVLGTSNALKDDEEPR